MDAHRPTDELAPTLVIGGTGMLRPAVRTLLESGHDVAIIARRPECGAPGADTAGRFLPITGDWRDPSSLSDRIRATGHAGRIPTVIAWVHDPHRPAVMESIDAVIAPDATVVHLWGSVGQDPRDLVPAFDPVDRRRVRHVVLGYMPHGRHGADARWLTDAEISTAVLQALDSDERITVAGRIEPWHRRPGSG